MKSTERSEARRLRIEEGCSIKEIARRVGVSVSSVSLWVRDLELTPQQHAALEARNPARNGQLLGARRWSERCRERRIAAQEHGRALARERRPGFEGGCMLYWAEGSKSRNSAELVNADAAVLAVFLRFLVEHYGVAPEQTCFTVNCFTNNGLSVAEIEGWWLERLGLPSTCVRKAVVNRPSAASQRKKHRVLLYGTGRLAMRSTFVVQSIYGGIQELAGIERPEWLDL